MKKADIVIVFIAIALAGVVFGVIKLNDYGKLSSRYVLIYSKGKLITKVKIKDFSFKDRVCIKNELGENIISIEKGGARIVEADCHDKICIKSGFIDTPGQSLICLPHKLTVEIKNN